MLATIKPARFRIAACPDKVPPPSSAELAAVALPRRRASGRNAAAWHIAAVVTAMYSPRAMRASIGEEPEVRQTVFVQRANEIHDRLPLLFGVIFVCS